MREADDLLGDFRSVAEEFTGRQGRPCVVGEALRQEDLERPEIARQMRATMSLSKEELQHTAIARAFIKFGHKSVTDNVVSRHRNGDCRHCYERM